MKQTLLVSLVILLAAHFAHAQDIITKRTGEKLQAKVLEISSSEIKYKNFSNLEGPTYVLAKADVLLIQYENKTNEVFDIENTNTAKPFAKTANVLSLPVTTAAPQTETAMQSYQRGQIDAETFYEGYKGAGTAVLVTSLFSPLLGLVPAIATSSTPSKPHNLDAPNSQLLQNADYASGYNKSARKIKSRKVWTNWGIALGVNFILTSLVISSQ